MRKEIEQIPKQKENKERIVSFRCTERHYQMLKQRAKSEDYATLGRYLIQAGLNFKS